MKGQIKRIISIFAVMTVAITMVGCSRKPSEVLCNRIEEIKAEGCNAVLTLLEDDKEKDNTSNLSQCLDSLNAVINQMDYKINSEKINGNTATVSVTVTGLDCSKIMDRFAEECTSSCSAEKIQNKESLKQDEIAKENDEIISNIITQSEVTERTMDIELVKEDNEWTIKDNKELLKLLINLDEDKLNI